MFTRHSWVNRIVVTVVLIIVWLCHVTTLVINSQWPFTDSKPADEAVESPQ